MSELTSSGINPIREPNKDEEVKKLAQLTRAKGMGLLRGKFPQAISKDQFGSWTSVLGFIQGDSVATNPHSAQVDRNFDQMIGRGIDQNHPLRETRREPHIQNWVISQYKPPQNRQVSYERKGLFGKKEVIHEVTRTYKGKHGEEGWVQYEYVQPVDSAYDRNSRPGVDVTLVCVVPPDIARDIDKSVTGDPTFPDAFFKELYPGLIGPDVTSQIHRIPVEGIRVIDLREDSKNPKIEIKKYPSVLPD